MNGLEQQPYRIHTCGRFDIGFRAHNDFDGLVERDTDREPSFVHAAVERAIHVPNHQQRRLRSIRLTPDDCCRMQA